MNDYMTALHQRFYREPDFSELEEEIEQTHQEVRDCLDKMQRRRLMHLVDTQNLLREETSLASFTAGFKLAGGLPGNWKRMVYIPSKRRKSSEPVRLWNGR